jgi:transposase InsO family protein
MKPMISNNINGFANASISNERIYDINHLHKLFGHCGQEILNKTIKMYGFKSSGSFDTYEQCAIAKARQKNVNEKWLGSSNLPDERLYIDISSIKERSFGGEKFWALIVDDYSEYCWSIVMKNKSDLQTRIKALLTDLKIANQIVKFIRCDDAGENMTTKNDPEIKSFGIEFEFSGPRTPQRNGNVERKFQTLYGRIRAMLNEDGLEGELRDKIWAACVMNVTYLSNIMSTKSSFKSQFELFYGEKTKLHDNLKMLGEVGVITTKDKIQAKLSNRGTTCMFVGYTEHHSRDVYRMLNLTTNSIINSRDIIWLNKT